MPVFFLVLSRSRFPTGRTRSRRHSRPRNHRRASPEFGLLGRRRQCLLRSAKSISWRRVYITPMPAWVSSLRSSVYRVVLLAAQATILITVGALAFFHVRDNRQPVRDPCSCLALRHSDCSFSLGTIIGALARTTESANNNRIDPHRPASVSFRRLRSDRSVSARRQRDLTTAAVDAVHRNVPGRFRLR